MYRITLLVLTLFVAACDQQSVPPEQIYPWQITLLPDGGSRVFGITLNDTQLGQAQSKLGTRYDAGLFENPDGSLSLEIFYNEVTLGGLSGKFILSLAASEDMLRAMRKRAVDHKKVDSGALRYRLAKTDQQHLLELPISAISYIPYVNLDEEMVLQRFGTPLDRIVVAEGKRHLLYPEKGLDLLLDNDGKELLQYVAPRDYSRLRQPLLRPSDS